ncbi:beta-ketoacyl synthase N-terminal-like domain-containing protein [Streptomyces sp. NPDC004250]|uniref:beta-ketoacyl synthase N-terminal-like domain-containing protein n=1 Tax=Streptomyces sp. NPDC004250 TaxID=3364692 RepID=UPI0036CB5A2E
MNSEPTGQPYTVVVTGVGLAVPGLADPAGLLGAADPSRPDGGGEPFDPETALKGRELRHKDRATRLALRAVEPALRDAQWYGAEGPAPDAARTAVVVSSNTGNVDSVCGYVDTAALHTSRAISATGLPQTSTSAIAGWIAAGFGLRGPALTLCNGATSGLDALRWGRGLIAAGRADTVIVTGVEPHNDVVARLLGARAVDGAASVVLESAGHAAARGVRGRARLRGHGRGSDPAEVLRRARGQEGGEVGLWLTGAPGPDREHPPAGARPLALEDELGQCGGALGVLQCVAAVAHYDRGGAGLVVATAHATDACAAVAFQPPC